MNIFALSDDPAKAAKWHMRSHITKMPLEYAQLLSTASSQAGFLQGYRPAHVYHPSTIWTGRSLDNWLWVRELGLELGAVFKTVYGKDHKSTAVIRSLKKPPIPSLGLQQVDLAMYDWLKQRDWKSDVEAYRTFYRSCKLHLAEWPSERHVPPWWDVPKYFVKPSLNGRQKLVDDMRRHHGAYGVKWLKREWKLISKPT